MLSLNMRCLSLLILKPHWMFQFKGSNNETYILISFISTKRTNLFNQSVPGFVLATEQVCF